LIYDASRSNTVHESIAMRPGSMQVAGFAACAAAVSFLGATHATAPMAKTQAPGYYRMMLGDFEVTALHHAHARRPRHLRAEGNG
jgi:hypothetical protein